MTRTGRAWILLLTLAPCGLAAASAPRAWIDRTAEAFRQGRLDGVAAAGEGAVVLAPHLEVRHGGDATRYWDVAVDRKGRAVVASGDPGTVLRYDPASGRAEVIFRATEPEVQAVAVAGEVVFAATGPEGRIYRLAPGAEPAIWFDPPDPYIWCLVADAEGRLYAGTGSQGVVYVVEPDGRGRVLYDTPAAHVRTLALGRAGDLLAGTGERAYVYRFHPGGTTEVLFAPPEQEVTSVREGRGGELFVSAVGAAGTPRPAPPERRDGAVPGGTLQFTVTADDPGDSEPEEAPPAAVAPQRPPRPARSGRATAVYRIDRDGAARPIYSTAGTQTLALAVAPAGELYAGTGEPGVLLRLAADLPETKLATLEAGQVSALAVGPGGGIFAVTANPGSLVEMTGGAGREGTYLSEVKDAGRLADWGRVAWDASVPGKGTVEVSARVGNTNEPDDTWSAWASLPPGSREGSLRLPAGRYLQYRAVLRSGGDPAGPSLREVRIHSLERNEAPQVEEPEILAPGVMVVSIPNTQPPDQEAVMRAEAEADGRNSPVVRPPTRKTFREGMRTLTWKASDPNGDPLRFDVEFQPLPEGGWRLLATGIEDSFLVFDTHQLPDGAYRFRIRATDDRANPPARALAGEAMSRPLDIDNTPPRVEETRVESADGGLVIRAVARDGTSAIAEMRYALDAGPWVLVLPEDGIPDSLTEAYRLPLRGLEAGDHLVVLQVRDAVGNVGSGKIGFTVR